MRVLLVALVLWSLVPMGVAQIPAVAVDTFQAPPDPHWSPIAVGDVKAAYRLLKDNHPGAATEFNDSEFVRRLDAAYTEALRRAAKVVSYQGYLATLAGFATVMGDKHIWSRPTFVVNLPRWPEFLVSKRGDNWVVTDTEQSQSVLKGATLLSCDGEAAAELARKNLAGFHAVWSVGAQQFQSAPWLFVDEGNPFIKRPGSCVFDQGGQQVTVTLNWMRIKRENLLPRLKAAGGAGAAGFGLRRLGDGYWIALQDLMSDKALGVVKAVEQQKESLRDARFVVLDMRGNGGGSSEMGHQIAVSLLGEAAVDARLGPTTSNECGTGEVWRATKDNLAQLEFMRTAPFVVNGGAEIQRLMAQLADEVRTALAAGREFSAPLHCAPPPKPAGSEAPPPLMKGRLILLTDNACFSSCLDVTEDFRDLGALHVGQTTDADTRFMEVREQYLPSGYSLFSTLQAVSSDVPRGLGPYDPKVVYDGDIADTAALEAWITHTVLQ